MLKEFAYDNGQLVVRSTGARIDLNNSFFRDVASVASLTMEVSAICVARAARARVAPHHEERRLRIGFTPDLPQVWHTVWQVCQLAGIEIVRHPADADIMFHFEDNDGADPLSSGLPLATMINGACRDIRKSRLADIFAETFGYPLAVDPLTHHGLAVMKSDSNGVHDGQVMPCPYLTPRDGSVYQRLVDNTRDGRIFTDIQTTVVGGMLPLVYLKQRTAATRFGNDYRSVSLTSADDQFSRTEQEKIVAFTARFGLDFGSLDILRDRRDGRLYIVDVNKTDLVPPTALPRHAKRAAMEKLADVFRGYVSLRLDKTEAA